MYFISRLWPHFLYFSCIYSIIWPNLHQDDFDGKILHLQNIFITSLSKSMPHSIILRFFAASSSSNSTSLTSTLSQNHGPSSSSSTNLKVMYRWRLSETFKMDGWGALAAKCHIWQWWRRRWGRRWEGVRHRGGGGGSRTAQVSIAQTQLSTFSTQSSAVGWSVITRRGEHPWPPFSPDLSLLDIFLGFRQRWGVETEANEGRGERSGSLSQRRHSSFRHDEFLEKGGNLSHNGMRPFRICTRSI